MKLITVRVFLNDGSNYVTSASGNCSDEDIRFYFVGASFTRADEATKDICTHVEITR